MLTAVREPSTLEDELEIEFELVLMAPRAVSTLEDESERLSEDV